MSTFGVRFFVTLVLELVSFYFRHKANIDEAMPPGVDAAMTALGEAIDAIKSHNVPGPL